MITVYNMDVREGLKQIPNESVDCVVTSPPYWALRDYGEGTESIWDGNENCKHEWGENILASGYRSNDSGAGELNKNNVGSSNRDKRPLSNFCSKCGAWKGQLGLEPTFDLYIKHLIQIFREVKRVLRSDRTIWINIGSAFCSKDTFIIKEEWEDLNTR